ncbi:MAG: hypothetical protein Kow0077_18060 [Anaerolineae bacterium]
MSSLWATLAGKLKPLLDVFDVVTSFAKDFQGFNKYAAFVILIGVVILTTIFTPGAADKIFEYLGILPPEQLYDLYRLALILVFAALVLVTVLAFVDQVIRRWPKSETKLVGAVGTAGVVSKPWWWPFVGGLLSILGVGRPPQQSAPEVATSVLDSPLPPERVFISYAPRDHERACRLAPFLRQHGYYVWPIEEAGPHTPLNLETAQAIRRSDLVVLLLSNGYPETIQHQAEVDFAHEIRKPIIPVLVEPPGKRLQQWFKGRKKPPTLYQNWAAEAPRILALLREKSAQMAAASSGADLASPTEAAVPAATQPVAPPTRPRPATREIPGVPAAPFIYGSAVLPELFVGRQKVLHAIRGRMSLGMQSVSVVANRRMGKTSLLLYLVANARTLLNQPGVLPVYINMQGAHGHSPQGVMRALRRGIERDAKRVLWSERDDGDLMVMSEAFEELTFDNTHLLLCLDEFESVMAYQELDDLIDALRHLGSVGHIGMVVATAHSLADLARAGKLTSPFYNIFETEYLGLMPRTEWEVLVRQAYQRTGRTAEKRELDLIGDLAGGHPTLTQMAGAVVWQARNEGWTRAEIWERYIQMANPLLTSIWAWQTESQRAAICEALGIHMEERAPQAVWDDLIRRGVLTADGDVFCKPFADIVLAEAL